MLDIIPDSDLIFEAMKIVLFAGGYTLLYIIFNFYLPLTLILILIGMTFKIFNMPVGELIFTRAGVIILVIGLVLTVCSAVFFLILALSFFLTYFTSLFC